VRAGKNPRASPLALRAPGSPTNTSVFTATTTSIFLSDASSTSQIGVTVGTIASASITDGTGANAVNISADTLADATGAAAQTALGHIDSAIANVASIRGNIGAGIEMFSSVRQAWEQAERQLPSSTTAALRSSVESPVLQKSSGSAPPAAESESSCNPSVSWSA
jgi:flagellin-like hook-associated protein FlgL